MKNWLRSNLTAPFERTQLTDVGGQKSATSMQPLVALHLSHRAMWSSRDYLSLVRQGYQKNAIVYRCVRLIAQASASVPLCVRRNDQCPTQDDPALNFLLSGNSENALIDILEQFYGYLHVSGNGYLEASLVDGVPRALYSLRPDRMRVLISRQGWPYGWEYQLDGYKRTFRRDSESGRSPILHMRLFHPCQDQYGFSPLEAAAQAIDVHNEGGRWAKALLDNSARPSGALIYKGSTGTERLSDEQFERLKVELEGAHSGAHHAGRPLLLEGGLDWKAMSLSPTDMDFIEARREAAREIALAFGVPPMLLGIPGDNTYANYKEANLAFWRQTIIPLVQRTAPALQMWLRPFFGEDLHIVADLDKVPALGEERRTLWQRLNETDFLSDEERRVLAGLPARHSLS